MIKLMKMIMNSLNQKMSSIRYCESYIISTYSFISQASQMKNFDEEKTIPLMSTTEI